MTSQIIGKLLILPGIIIGLTVHEFAHAKVASMMGDNTAESMGRCSLNPLKHIDWIGIICLFFMGFGWGKPVPVNPWNLTGRNRKLKQVAISAAGIVTNFIVALVFAILMGLLMKFNPGIQYDTSVMGYVYLMVAYTMQINIVLMIFNLIPIPPLDGFNIVAEITSFDETPLYHKLLQYGSILLIVLLVTNVISYILTPGIDITLSLFDRIIGLIF